MRVAKMNWRSPRNNDIIFFNVFKTGPVIEPKKLPVHGSLVGPTVESMTS